RRRRRSCGAPAVEAARRGPLRARLPRPGGRPRRGAPPVPRGAPVTGRHRGGPGRRVRPWAVAATLVVGAVVLAATLRLEPGDARFVPAALALAAVWLGGALVAGTRVGWGGQGARGPGLGPAAGAVLPVLCLAAGPGIARVPGLADPAAELDAPRAVGVGPRRL